jgi:hypothetical protein
MNLLWPLPGLALAIAAGFSSFNDAAAQPTPARDQAIPEALKPWADWALWDEPHRNCPTPFSDPKKHQCFWPSLLDLKVEPGGAQMDLLVVVFHETWIPLPGGDVLWPIEVKAGDNSLVVIEREGAPAVQLPPGTVHLTARFQWTEIPQKIRLPHEIGILALTLGGSRVISPAWDAEGMLWLKRDGAGDETDKDFLAAKIYRVLEDGIPVWLRTDLELIVSGKSREEELGVVVPDGWKTAAVESPIPVAIDDSGNLKAQVRAGKWTVHLDAFRFDNPKEIRYAADAKRPVTEELVALQTLPEFRIVEIIGPPSVDVSQTTFPEKWRSLPVFRWEPPAPFHIEERLRGMGAQQPAGLTITREMWLDDNGGGVTFRDAISGRMQQIWRLDAAPGQALGSIRSGGEGQLITRNPETNAAGVEIRTRNIDLNATGRVDRARNFSATGWQCDADALTTTLNLPPGWRLFALFGADWVRGDWLTAWTLLDLFLLLIFTVAVWRMHGPAVGTLAFFAFGLAYQEPGAPRLIWLFVLAPIALLRLVDSGTGRTIVLVAKWIAIAVFLAITVPFVATQVQQAIYPQLESVGGGGFFERRMPRGGLVPQESIQAPAPATETAAPPPGSLVRAEAGQKADSYQRFAAAPTAAVAGVRKSSPSENLKNDPTARIQTGPGVPRWKWRVATFGWNGPVRATQQIHPVLIPATLERLLAVLRIALVMALAGLLFNARKLGAAFARSRPAVAGAASLLGLFYFSAGEVEAQIPDKTMLDTLRQRLLETSDAFPHAADIPLVSVNLRERHLVIDAEIHTAAAVSVPVPGRLPSWSPIAATVDDKPAAALRREDGFLWIALSKGIHRVRVEGELTNISEWEFTFELKPRRVQVDAPGWTITGLRADGAPEQQIFFALKQRPSAAAGAASYDRQDLQSVVRIDRECELGLRWQVRTTAQRLSPTGKAIALRIPLLPGENVLTSNALVKEGFIEVRLGAQEPAFTWESELPITNQLDLATRVEDSWVERWHVVASPIWNVAFTGLAPTFDAANAQLVPVWQPWPGETVHLEITRPDALAGATITVNTADHEETLGKRQRASKLQLAVTCSLGTDFLIDLPANAEITALSLQQKSIPVRKAGNSIVVPLQPGAQTVMTEWKSNAPLDVHAAAGQVRLPVDSANIQTTIHVPEDRWILWAHGPLRGPAVRFWIILACSILAAWILGRIGLSPLRTIEWVLLLIGLTQVPLAAALTVIAWLFLLKARGQSGLVPLSVIRHNLLQIFLMLLTAAALGILVTAVGEGLLGNPEMFISGNGSDRTSLIWYQARSGTVLPRPGCFSISIWWYRFLMLLWALWLALAVIRWLRWGWENFSRGGIFRRNPRASAVPPPLPTR